jgi:hypothetical protein
VKNFFINLTVTSTLLATISPLAFAQNSNDFKLNNHVLATKKDNIAFKTFTAPGWFSFQHPVNWTVTSYNYSNQPNSGFALATKYLVFIQNTTSFSGSPPANYIKSQIDIYPVKYKNFVAEELSGTNNLIKLGGGKYKKGSTKVGGREAFRIWFYSNTTTIVTTLIRYSDNETVRVLSSYDPSNSSALPLTEKIHGSFRSLKQTSNSSSLTASKKK